MKNVVVIGGMADGTCVRVQDDLCSLVFSKPSIRCLTACVQVTSEPEPDEKDRYIIEQWDDGCGNVFWVARYSKLTPYEAMTRVLNYYGMKNE